jgi:hypothetical protein
MNPQGKGGAYAPMQETIGTRSTSTRKLSNPISAQTVCSSYAPRMPPDRHQQPPITGTSSPRTRGKSEW